MEKALNVLRRFDEIAISQKIGILFILNKIYLDKDLRADGFAKKIGIQTRFVAPVFQSLYGHRLHELATMYRVEYAKAQIEAGTLNHDSMESLAQMSGFKSKSSFVNRFKKEAGMSPSKYSKSQKIRVK
jgi:AraC-like DNA-binding protein